MELIYNSTRNKEEKVTASQAILRGLAPDGGLYVPAFIPALDRDMKEFAGARLKCWQATLQSERERSIM